MGHVRWRGRGNSSATLLFEALRCGFRLRAAVREIPRSRGRAALSPDVIRAAQAGDERAWVVLYARLRPIVRSQGHRYGQAFGADLDDLEAFIWHRLWLALPSYTDGNLIAWAWTVTRNASMNWKRGRRRFYRRHVAATNAEGKAYYHGAAAPDRPDRSALARIDAERAMGQLHGRDAVAVRMTADGWGGNEIAAVLGTTPGNARKVLLRAREQIRPTRRAPS
jgi:RNA polymerase sigma factor (sigma-70 family)